MLVPKTRMIEINGEVIGTRDPSTGNLITAAGKDNWSIVADVVCSDSPLLTGEQVNQVLWAGGTPMTGEELL